MRPKGPTPRSRKSSGGDTSDVPAGFTLSCDSSGNSGWRCPVIQQTPRDREWRRCSRFLQKRDCAPHLRAGKHQFEIPRATDPVFPSDFDTRHQQLSLQRGFDQIHQAIAKFTGRSNLSGREASGDPLADFVCEVCNIAIRLRDPSSTFQPSFIPRISATKLTQQIRQQGDESFTRQLEKFTNEIRYVSFLADSGTVPGFNTVHVMIVNPDYPEKILPLESCDNHGLTGDDYEIFFRENIEFLQKHDLEIVAVVCDNCPAQVNGVAQALVFHTSLAIRHIPCFNHMVNLVFELLLRRPVSASRMGMLHRIVECLRSTKVRNVLG
jgi:hypothetical protein